MASSEERRDEPVKELVHKTKVIQFLGRTTPIILQNDNGPCPLLAICNILLLKNNLNVSPEISEVSQEKLLSLVAERLIDSNSNVDNKDAGYLENQQQNIADAIDLLPRLATGIDVNIKFRRIDDFEFTRECAIFDLLDIPLYHGWIVDPQDHDTACAIDSKSYNTLMGELVALEAQNMECENNRNTEEDCIDFVAATTAALGVPSPCLSRGRSFDDSPRAISDYHKQRKGDVEEEAELLRAMKLSEVELPNPVNDESTFPSNLCASSNDSARLEKSEHGVILETPEEHISGEDQMFYQQKPSTLASTSELSSSNIDGQSEMSYQPETSVFTDSTTLSDSSNDLITFPTVQKEADSPFSKTDLGNLVEQSMFGKPGECMMHKDVLEKTTGDALDLSDSSAHLSSARGNLNVGDEHIQDISYSSDETRGAAVNQSGCGTLKVSDLSTLDADLDSSSGRQQEVDMPKACSSLNGSEPMYEGEECVMESGTKLYEVREPMYEGEVVLAEQVGKSSGDECVLSSKDAITPQQGELIRNFLKNSANQLTVNGLFCLQDGLKERELCVFFRNNHFSTMFKLDGELYLLATDQGYINQPDLVWEKLNEVNGDTEFMTGTFKEFKVENHENNTWDEQNVMASTADYLASIDNSARDDSHFNSDLELAIALQQQEFEQQQQQQQSQSQAQPPRSGQQPGVSGNSRLVTGPQVVPRRSSTPTKQPEAKSKEKCVVM